MSSSLAKLFIAGEWTEGSSGERLPVYNPATEELVGEVCVAAAEDLDTAIEAAQVGLGEWRKVPAWDKGTILFDAARQLRGRAEDVGRSITIEEGKPLQEAVAEVRRAADFLEWGAGEARRLYDRVHAGRSVGNVFQVRFEPIGVVAAFTPWNFPIVQLAKKIAALLAAGCTCVAKPAEETPTSCVALIEVLLDAGVPPLALNLVFGIPDKISSHLIASPHIQKVTFTGSVPVGKLLASMAGKYMKPATMELGGHAAAIVFDDVNVEKVARYLAARKFVNAGQVCVAPTRFYVQDAAYDRFLTSFTEAANKIVLGDGLRPQTTMGPLANRRRLDAIEQMVAEATESGAKIHSGGSRIGNRGLYYPPTVLSEVDPNCSMMQSEPFGPVAPVNRFSSEHQVIEAANSLDFGLSSYVFTQDIGRQERVCADLQVGMVGVNDVPFHLPELPFGGWKDSGYGTEGGIEMLQGYLKPKVVSTTAF
ncbi:NAD-dependent succinate-semialdehyde dehydrogenase [Pelagibacterium luteolum]|uniref:Succinate-semialdehyde dehydrogenase / glutarate-semialdehyde dehydrogenase n=1 Tax=Pelagibacterium luteolum TaxID=440168 RepID=A0A1G7ZSD5_9HYPH|nr:NAD-dependent succinate-semialdehyde dehydrogenase [Pelagibacterium luteolum]SDH11537.1 succinate-semialdehyde dehydrogenase / glutarate-semialdehyde dehydrogenase [Pelagibacterium luteolum]